MLMSLRLESRGDNLVGVVGRMCTSGQKYSFFFVEVSAAQMALAAIGRAQRAAEGCSRKTAESRGDNLAGVVGRMCMYVQKYSSFFVEVSAA